MPIHLNIFRFVTAAPVMHSAAV
ncbi:hypothetical protein XHV734_3276 [Xanthomonas hortorum pv. vitians]|nr:hypothetical protein XHV734_3276 [Xanthomonas hortorum pv. vitians]